MESSKKVSGSKWLATQIAPTFKKGEAISPQKRAIVERKYSLSYATDTKKKA